MGIITVNKDKFKYRDTSDLDENYTDKMNAEYNRMAKIYDPLITLFPLWKKWIKTVIPHIKGNKILEVSFGSGYLMTQYASTDYDIYGIDYNRKMITITMDKLNKKNIKAELLHANVEKLPFPDNTFDTVINTMAFTGYPDGEKELRELYRVLKNDGRLLLVDFDYPENRNRFGYMIIKFWEKCGDIIKDINSLLTKHNFDYQDIPVGCFGSVHFFVCKKKNTSP